ncbi:hypothetical protein [Azohydromonas australica]|uniref:hypothetical protein n=1 Tax=Azohydromonas australica TaxID=364039 RepID=UPI000401A279|nr:hypothetical protein [Azohydromonas australica]
MAKSGFSNAANVAAFFAYLKQSAPSEGATAAWLADLERQALAKRTVWRDEAEAYVRGLAAAGKLSADAAAACRDRLGQCLGSEPAKRELLLPLAWIAAVSAAAVSRRTMAEDLLMPAVPGLLAAAVGWWWTYTRPWMQQRNDPRQRRWERPILCTVVAAVLAGFTYFVPGVVGEVMQEVSIRRFQADHAALKADPTGFPMLRELAREHYGIKVVLGDAGQSWATTSVALPNASPASMTLHPGYCHLSMNRANVLRIFKPAGHVSEAVWIQGVMLHEFAHCLDGSRDAPTFSRSTVGTRSLAPSDAVHVKDLEGWLAAGELPATQLWREAVADVMAVGYWRLAAPGNAHDLVASLRKKRSNATHDTAHATMCWIDFAARAEAPSSLAELFAWADRLRTQAPCELSQRREPT